MRADRPLSLVLLLQARGQQPAHEVFGDGGRAAVAGPADEDGFREGTLTFEHRHAAAHHLAGFGGQVEVLSPDSVRAEILATAREILGRYPSP